MHFVGRDPKDFPLPPSVDETAEQFAVPLMAFIQQPSLTELDVASVGSSSGGGPTSIDSVAITYTWWRKPEDKDDPVNLADLTALERESLGAEPVRPPTDWMLEMRRLMQYPSLWEAIITTRALDAEWQSPKSVLVDHTNHILTNTFRDQRVSGGFPGILNAPVREQHIEPFDVLVGGVSSPGCASTPIRTCTRSEQTSGIEYGPRSSRANTFPT